MRKKIIAAIIFILNLMAAFSSEDFINYDEENIERLSESVITADGFETTLRETAKNVTVITKEDIDKKNISNVFDALKSVSGINLINTSSGYLVDIRGQGERAKYNVALLIDGVQINPIDVHSAAPLYAVSIDEIERIEVMAGSGSVLYGNGAAGGVVNIITKSNQLKKNKGNLKFGYGSYNSLNYGGDYGINYKNIFFNISYYELDKDGYQDEEKSNEKNFNTNLNLKISEKQNIKISYSKYDSELTSPEMLTKEQLEEDREQSGYAEGDKKSITENKRDDYRLEYNFKINDSLNFTSNIFNAETKKNNFDDETLSSIFSDDRYGGGIKFKYEYNKNGNFITGYDYADMLGKRDFKHMLTVYNPYILEFSKKINTVFLMNKNRFKNFEINEGFRYEKADYNVVRNLVNVKSGSVEKVDVERDMNNNALELGINWLYSNSGNVYARYEKGYVSPTPNQLLEKRQDKTYHINTELDSEKHNTIEIGMKDYLMKKVFASLSVFYTKSSDEIIIERKYGNGMSDPYTYINIDESEKKGSEVFFEQYLGKFNLNQRLTYVESKITGGSDKGKMIPRVPKNILGMGIEYEVIENLKFNLDTQYTGSFYIDTANTKALKQSSYTITNLKAGYKFSNVTLNCGINNIFNKKYELNKSYNESTMVTTYTPAPEINYYADVKYEF